MSQAEPLLPHNDSVEERDQDLDDRLNTGVDQDEPDVMEEAAPERHGDEPSAEEGPVSDQDSDFVTPTPGERLGTDELEREIGD